MEAKLYKKNNKVMVQLLNQQSQKEVKKAVTTMEEVLALLLKEGGLNIIDVVDALKDGLAKRAFGNSAEGSGLKITIDGTLYSVKNNSLVGDVLALVSPLKAVAFIESFYMDYFRSEFGRVLKGKLGI